MAQASPNIPYHDPAHRTAREERQKKKTKKEAGKMTISFFHECDPPKSTAQQRQFFRKGTALTPAAKKAKATWLAIVEQYKPAQPLEGALSVTIIVTWHRKRGLEPRTTRPDLDNVAKLLLDAMTKAGYWNDDNQVYDLRLTKFNGPLPGVSVIVEKGKEQ